MRRGSTFVELLAAALLLAIASVCALSTWDLASRLTARKRVLELTTYVSVSEMERLKTHEIEVLPVSGPQVTTYYDRDGKIVSGNPPNPLPPGGYKAVSTINTVSGTAALREITIRVWDAPAANPQPYHTSRTLVTTGGY